MTNGFVVDDNGFFSVGPEHLVPMIEISAIMHEAMTYNYEVSLNLTFTRGVSCTFSLFGARTTTPTVNTLDELVLAMRETMMELLDPSFEEVSLDEVEMMD